MVTKYDYLDIKPEDGEFFLPHQLCPTLKDNILTDEEYKNVKKFYQTMKLENLGELNKICNFQGTIILCEMSEQRSSHLQNLLNSIPESVILQALSAAAFIETKANLVLPYQLTLNMSEFLKRR